MVSKKAIDLMVKSLLKLHRKFDLSLDNILKSVAELNSDQTGQAILDSQRALEALTAGLPNESFPEWAKDMQAAFAEIESSKNVDAYSSARAGLIKRIVDLKPVIHRYTWDFDDTADDAIDFDRVFEGVYKESELPQLFDKLIAQIDDLITAGLVDDARAMQSLNSLLATLKRKSKNEYYAAYGKIRILRNILKNTAYEFLKSIPVIKQAMAGVEKTMKDVDKEWEKLNSNVNLAESTEVQKKLGIPAPPLGLPFTPESEHVPQLNGRPSSKKPKIK